MTGPRDLNAQTENLVHRLRRRQVVGSFAVSHETALLMRQVVSTTRWTDIATLIRTIKEIGRKLMLAQPRELAVGNVVRRVLRLIRDVNSTEGTCTTDPTSDPDDGQDGLEDDGDHADDDQSNTAKHTVYDLLGGPGDVSDVRDVYTSTSTTSMINLLGDGSSMAGKVLRTKSINLKPSIISELNEFINELENMYINISEQAMEHIHSNEIIMTAGYSRTVEGFLKTAAEKRKFSVVVAETSPTYRGHDLAVSLAQAGIDTTVITDSAIFAVMSRVNKVLLGTHAVLANGGLIAVSGTQLVAAAAKQHSTPVVVCTGLYKMSPLFPYDVDSFSDLIAPNPVLEFQEGDLVDKVTVLNPYYDYVSPELVDLYITNTGGHPPSYLYRLINENYDPEDTII